MSLTIPVLCVLTLLFLSRLLLLDFMYFLSLDKSDSLDDESDDDESDDDESDNDRSDSRSCGTYSFPVFIFILNILLVMLVAWDM